MTQGHGSLELVRLSHGWEISLMAFFAALVARGDDRFFHPHPFDSTTCAQLCGARGADLYYIATRESAVLGYGMLRGWDAGFVIPSLGIAIHPDARGTGLSTLLMEFLHASARMRGASRVRLKVHSENTSARRLYERLGYVFETREGNEDVGHISL